MAEIHSILVTGANQGLGMHSVRQLASNPNVLVFMGSRKVAAAEEALAKFSSEIHPSSSVVPVQLDVTDDDSIQAAHAAIADHLKSEDLPGLDLLINNAGVMVPSFKETYQVNVFGTVAVTAGIRPSINPGGAILNISSIYGSRSQLPKIEWFHVGLAAYSSSKSALNNLTVRWALDEKKKGSGDKHGIRLDLKSFDFGAWNILSPVY